MIITRVFSQGERHLLWVKLKLMLLWRQLNSSKQEAPAPG
jgi:hypothetical protein